MVLVQRDENNTCQCNSSRAIMTGALAEREGIAPQITAHGIQRLLKIGRK